MLPNLSVFTKYSKFGLYYLISLFQTDLSILTGKNFAKPRQIYYFISEKCNARCEMCCHWEKGNLENKEDLISLERMKEILITLAHWKIIKFGISGGEPLLFYEKTFKLLEIANALGLYTHFVTNGWLLDKEIFLNYEKIGGGHVSLSLDGIGETHDQLRKKPGLFDRCINAINTFKSLRLKKVKMKINSVISKKNHNDIAGLLKISEENNIPIFFQPVDMFNYESLLKLNQDEIADNYPLWIPSDENEMLEKHVNAIKTFKRRLPHLIVNTENHLNLICSYFKNEIHLRQNKKCLVAYDTIFILPNGDISFCWIGKVGNLKENGVKETYYSPEFDVARNKALNCNYPCMLGCLNRPGLLELVKIGLKTCVS